MEVFRKVRLDSGRDAVYACTPGQVTATHIRQLARQVAVRDNGGRWCRSGSWEPIEDARLVQLLDEVDLYQDPVRRVGCRQPVCTCHDDRAWERPESYPNGCSACGCRRA